MKLYRDIFKRGLDVSISFMGLIVLLPVMLIISILIKVDDGGKILFIQKRLGKDKNEFYIFKFRTMIENAYKIGGSKSSESDKRITKIGRVLRRTSLDEIPQLVNILLGQMSIIGPRPILKDEYAEFESVDRYKKRFDVRPGLFCTIDMQHRAAATREMQMKMDVKYVSQVSLKLDLIIFVKVFINVIKQKNIYAS